MSSVITLDFEKWKAQQVAAGKAVVLDEFVFANVPNLDPSKDLSRSEKLPAQNQIVHRQAVNKTGLASENAVAYSVTLGTEVGNFDFNWIGLINKKSGVIGMITHAPTQKKIKTASGLQGNVLTRSFLLEFDGAAKETAITTTAETWQIDFTARLSGMDEMQRLINTDSYGEAAFFEEGFAVIRTGDQYTVKKGLAYVGGLRGVLEYNQTLNQMRNTRIYVDFSYQGNLVSQWKTAVKITVANEQKNYVDAVGYSHHVFAIARIDGNGNVSDLRPKGTLSDRDIADIKQDIGKVKQDYATKQALENGLSGKQPKGDYATRQAVQNSLAEKQPKGNYATNAALSMVSENANSRLEKSKNGADIPDKRAFINHLGLADTMDLAKNAIPNSRRINGKWLTSDVTLKASDVDAVSASQGGTYSSDIKVAGGIFVGQQRPDLVLSSLGTAKSRIKLTSWGVSSRPTVLECQDDNGWMFYVQRLMNGSTQLSVEGEVIPGNYGNFDARYGNKNTALKSDIGWWQCGDTGIMYQWGTAYVPDDEYREFDFLMPFPTACVSLTATPIYTSAVSSTNIVSCHANIPSRFRFGLGLSATFSDSTLNRIFWLAVGY
ncbi:phage tail protein [Xenorhabdus koppenhoeferi]|uniref:phage tail-collar fiber domain-containing protein n=1 Tax=Xenorhabdus koppenhoeferi TaxID=351659 RepID=UPI002B40E015|nr:phage tail protein [Xenorhabdus sp. Vera]